MKKQLKTLAVVSLILGSCFNQVLANDGTTKKEVKSNTELVNTLNKKGKKIAKKNAKNLDVYVSVMDLYNNAPASFYNLDETSKNQFIAAAGELNESLATSRNKDVKSLASQVEFNKTVSNYIWSVKESNTMILPVVEKSNQQTSL